MKIRWRRYYFLGVCVTSISKYFISFVHLPSYHKLETLRIRHKWRYSMTELLKRFTRKFNFPSDIWTTWIQTTHYLFLNYHYSFSEQTKNHNKLIEYCIGYTYRILMCIWSTYLHPLHRWWHYVFLLRHHFENWSM